MLHDVLHYPGAYRNGYSICVRHICRGGSRIPCRRGADPLGPAPTYDFVKFSEKLHEIEKILGGTRAGGVPPKSATDMCTGNGG